ncbi:MAG TPA: TonB-dependent receptor [Polyangiaceae bacterium]|nr:TonB-dependent receptor [Polyangiaceae bacterium]
MLARVVLWIATLSVTTPVGAEPAAPAKPETPRSGTAAPELVPPKLSSDATALYPKGAHGDATVLLDLLVDRDGHVADVRVVSGEPPFSDAAAASARDYRFEPATRGEVAVRARIRFLVRFTAPPPETPEGAAPSPEPKPTKTIPAAKPVRAPEGAVEVEVQGTRPEVAASRLGRAEVRQMPGAFGDPFRAIEALPGVTPIVSGLPYFFVRGAPPGNVGYFLDGVRVPLLYHVAAGPSVIHPALVDKVDLYPGGYPARYGRFAGGIVAGETRPPANELHGEASLRLVDVGGLVEAPLFGEHVTGLVSGRYGYPGLILPLFAPEAILQYWDYQARAAVDVGRHGTASVFAFGAYDFVGNRRRDGTTEIGFASEFHRVDLRYDHEFSGRTKLRAAATVGFDRTRGDQDTSIRDRMVGSRVELRHEIGRNATLNAGADLVLDFFDVGTNSTSSDAATLVEFVPTRRDVTTGVYADLSLRVDRRVRITPGLRADLYAWGVQTSVGIDPRISAEYTVSDRVRLLHAIGVAHQPPSFIGPIPGVQIGKGVLQTSLQHSFGVETQLPASFVGTATVFHNAMFDLTDVLGTTRPGQSIDGAGAVELLRDRVLGSTVGLELYVRRPLTRDVGGFLAYTLSRSVRSGGSLSVAPSNFDRTHVFQVAVAWNLGRRWRAGTRGMFYTGALDLREQRTPIPNPDGTFSSQVTTSTERRRLPTFYRLDVRLEKRWSLGERGYWAFVFEVLNATLTKEWVDSRTQIGPVTVPSIGLEAAF